MARTAKPNRKPASKAAPKPAKGTEIIGLIIMAFGVFLFISMITRASGVVGETLRLLMVGLLGLLSYIAPFIVVTIGGFVIASGKFGIRPGRVAITLCICALAVVVTHLPVQSNIIKTEGYKRFITDSYVYAQTMASGVGVRGAGAFGGVLSYPLLTLLGPAGSWIIAIAGILGCLMVLTRLSLREVGVRTARVARAAYESGQETASNLRERRNARIARREEIIVAEADDFPVADAPPPFEPAGRKAGRGRIDFRVADEAEPEPPLLEETADAPERHDRPRLMIDGVLIEDEELPEPGEMAPPAPIIEPWQQVPEARSKLRTAQREPGVRGGSLELPPAPYVFPTTDLLQQVAVRKSSRGAREEMEQNARKLEETLKSFGVDATVTGISRGPAITRYELSPAPGVRVSRISGLADDLALNLAAMGVRIEAPIPGKSAIGIEVPNSEISTVSLREVLESEDFGGAASRLACALGKDISGRTVVADLARMPHVLIAGATGSGKSVCINNLILSILYKATPEEVRFIMIDPKVVELTVYNGIPHLLIPVVTDPKKAASALQWAVTEMGERYKKFADKGVRDIKGFNEKIRNLPRNPDETAPPETTLPQIVVIIDELADLMMVAAGDVEDAIFRLAQLARAAGIHLVIATQRPSVNVITGVIKANIPSRIAFAVASQVDSRTILDMAGAEKLLGRGDMLYFPSGMGKPVRVQGAFVSEPEIENIVAVVRQGREAEYDPDIIEHVEQGGAKEAEVGGVEDEVDELLPQAIELAISAGQMSTSMLQRRFKIGYARAGRLVDAMELRGVVSPSEGSKARQVLITFEEYNRLYSDM